MTTLAETQTLTLAERSVGEIATSVPGATAIFRKFKLSFCCGGEAPLAQAAAERGIPLETLLAELSALDAVIPAADPADKGRIAQHVAERFHAAHRRELPELIRLARKVERVHGDHEQAPHGLADTLEDLVATLADQMELEETTLFPALSAGDSSRQEEITAEHAAVERALHDLEHLTDGFAPPPGACRSWQALYLGGAKLADDLRAHLALERSLVA
ncbi:DUF542 domain-containing protein [Salinarimonas ramus]|uniref:Iron-sulfur cluster repair di-iron protein n=1 Tax=Salinarimonas ramus TaxID=690164 RepID=A0A917QHJ6_9HYPH|nr:DUF542 domain-containing protein [Salinarimonas ramus]GGK51114.1 iron-sulfur cluster repair di-iron protein [Salinarimonas ramus]